MSVKSMQGHAGDWIEVHSPGGGPPRKGKILEVLGREHHEHYRVRWTDDHESIFFPADGAHVVPAAHAELATTGSRRTST
jgi:hypothetical protein